MAEPITLAQAKAHLRVSDTSEDALITALIIAAREWVENYTGVILVRRPIKQQFDSFGAYLALWRRPIVSVDAIAYVDSTGATQAYVGFVAQLNRQPVRVFPALNGAWPSPGANGDVLVTYTAGHAPGEEPKALLQAMLLLVGTWFEHREAAGAGATNEVPFAVMSLCDQHRVPVV